MEIYDKNEIIWKCSVRMFNEEMEYVASGNEIQLKHEFLLIELLY